MILRATVVLPEALPPQSPVGKNRPGNSQVTMVNKDCGGVWFSTDYVNTLTDNKSFFGLGPVFIVPRWASGGVDGPLTGPQQRRLWFALAGGSFPWRQAGADGWEEPVQRAFPTGTIKKKKGEIRYSEQDKSHPAISGVNSDFLLTNCTNLPIDSATLMATPPCSYNYPLIMQIIGSTASSISMRKDWKKLYQDLIAVVS